MDELLRDFLTETNENIEVIDVELVRFEREPNNAELLANIFRLVHTIKGTCGFLCLPRLGALTHAAEGLIGNFRDGAPVTSDAVTLILATIDRIKALLQELERSQVEQPGNDHDLIARLVAMSSDLPAGTEVLRSRSDPEVGSGAAPGPVSTPAEIERQGDERSSGPVAHQSIRVHVETLEHLMTMVSELVLTRNQLLEIVRRHEESEFKGPLQRLSNVTAELQEGVMKTRMQPIGNAWQKLPRIVRDLATELGKSIELETYGADTELDRQVLDLIKDPLTHMVRNSADHGLEAPAARRSAGKPEKGIIRLSARHESGLIVIEISDDGTGLDTEAIKAAAVARGTHVGAQAHTMAPAQIHSFIFAPSFSTARTVTKVSGRGVGMDVVRANIDQIGGTIDVKSVRGKGTSFSIKIPLTLAIVSALIVEAGGDRFAIPQLAVVELVRARGNSEHRIEHIRDAAVLRLRNKLLPLVNLKALLKLAAAEDRHDGNGFIVVTQVGSQMFGIVVDAVFHTEEIVVKPMSSKLRSIAMFAGNTILGDGSVIMIIDPNGVAQSIGSAIAARDAETSESADEARPDDAPAESMLLFRAGSPQLKAVPLSLVTRLEEIEVAAIETSNGRSLVQYRGQLMPLVPVADGMRPRSSGKQPLLVFSDQGRSMGLVVDEIVDIVEERLDIELVSDHPGILGSALIKGQATEVIEIGHFLPLAFGDWQHWRERRATRAARRVLLVDDSAFFRNMLSPLLKTAGYAVTGIASAPEALALLNTGEPFDVVVTDIDMPGMDGFALTAAIRRDARTATLPVIGLSSSFNATAERCRHAGLHDCVAKFDRQGLIAALKERSADLGRAA